MNLLTLLLEEFIKNDTLQIKLSDIRTENTACQRGKFYIFIKLNLNYLTRFLINL